MRLIINSEAKIFDTDAMTVEELLRKLDIPAEGTAVAVGSSVIKRENHPLHHLHEGDNVMIISAAYGG